MHKGKRTRAYRSSGGNPAFPARWFTAYSALSPVTGFLATVIPEKLVSQELDTSVGVSGPHDFSVRLRAIRQERIGVHRIPPRVCDDREPPLWVGRDQIAIRLFLPGCQTKFGNSEIREGDAGGRRPAARRAD